MMKSPRISRGALALLLILALSQAAYLILQSNTAEPLLWDSEKLPVTLELWQGFESAPGLVSGSRPGAAIRAAWEQWAEVVSLPLRFETTTVSSTALDGHNIVTIADSAANRGVLGDFPALTLVWTQPQEGRDVLIESDVLFNPEPGPPWSTVQQEGVTNLAAFAYHEFGHALGLKHVVARSATMFFNAGPAPFQPQFLAWDDVAGANLLYPLLGIELLTGSIRGKVVREDSESPVFGAFVVASDESGVLTASAITRADGRFEIENLPTGRYSLYAEPLDGPTQPIHIADGVFEPGRVDTDFLPRFHQDSMQPSVEVTAGAVVEAADIAVRSGSVDVDPEFIGIVDDPGGAFRVTTSPSQVGSGRNTHLVLAGAGVEELNSGSRVRLLSDRLSSSTLLTTRTNNDGILFRIFPLTIAGTAVRGEYTILTETSGRLGVVTGGLEVTGRYGFPHDLAHFFHLPGIAASRLLLFNPDRERSLKGVLEALDEQGSPADLALGGLTPETAGVFGFELPPAGATLLETQGQQQFLGSVHVDAQAALGNALLLDTPFGATGVGAAKPLHAFLVPVEVSEGGAQTDTGLALNNLDGRSSRIYLRLQDQAGNLRSQTTFELAGRAQLARFVRELLSVPDEFRGTLFVTSVRRLAATAIRTSPGVFTTFPVISNRIDSRLLFAHFGQAPGLSSELLLVNPSAHHSADEVEIQARDAGGGTVGVTWNGVFYPSGRATVSIPPLGTVRMRTGGAPVVGWLDVFSEIPVGGVLLFRSDQVGTAGVGESLISKEFVLPLQRDEEAGTDTGFALANTGPGQIGVRLQARGVDGSPTGPEVELVLGPFQNLARFPNDPDIDLGLPSDFTGTLWIDADGPVAVTAIRQSPGVLTTFSAVSLEQPVTPTGD